MVLKFGMLRSALSWFYVGILNTYSQLFFSDNRWFAYLLFLATFASPYSGLSGLCSVFLGLVFGCWFGLDSRLVGQGIFTFNALMVGLVMGLYFDWGWAYSLVLVLMSCLSVLMSVFFSTLFRAYGLPFLSLPFLFTIWIFWLSVGHFEAIGMDVSQLFVLNRLYRTGGMDLVYFYHYLDDLPIPLLVQIYFKSLGAIYFQYNLVSGFLIGLGLLFYSRIGFVLSVFGFLVAYLFYGLVSNDFSTLEYGYIGFNFMLSSIALGGFYVVASPKSFVLVLFSTLLIALFIRAFGDFFYGVQLPMYSLPSVLVVLLLLFVLGQRRVSGGLDLVAWQSYSPEKNLYQSINQTARFSKSTLFYLQPPFFGEWLISQGHNGSITHKQTFAQAWDFVVVDELQRTFRLPAQTVSDFYCHNLPVLSPADGIVVQLIDGTPDNAIGEVNLNTNWGNVLIIKHGEGLFSMLGHLKSGSFRCEVGQQVKSGEWLASCGSSGRSPEPHLHVQVQATAAVGEATLSYPLACYLSKNAQNKWLFNQFSIPKQGETISRIQPSGVLQKAYDFRLGGEMRWLVVQNNAEIAANLIWKIEVDINNQTYIFCEATQSSAYFYNTGTVFYFYDFRGKNDSVLYYFYLSNFKVLLAFYQDLTLSDAVPLHQIERGFWRWCFDGFAPFFRAMNVGYVLDYVATEGVDFRQKVTLKSMVSTKIYSKTIKKINFETTIDQDRVDALKIFLPRGQEICAKRIL